MVDALGLRVVFFGTPEFAVPTLDALLHSRHTVAGVVTRQDRPRGRGQQTSHTPVKALAVSRGIAVLQPDRIRDSQFLDAIREFSADLFVVAAYGKILPAVILDMPRLGVFNVHASLLPKYRGAAPIHRAVIDGEPETGITIIRLVEAMDAGPMLAAARRPIGADETSVDVEQGLAPLGAALLVSTLDALANGPVAEVPQDEKAATYAARLVKEEGNVDWSQSSLAIHNLIRGLYPWPHAFTHYRGKRLILRRSTAKPSVADGSSAPTGTILSASGDAVDVATGSGVLAITELQAEGRRPMTAREFLAGHALRAGDTLTMQP